jgi:hypothetical protein
MIIITPSCKIEGRRRNLKFNWRCVDASESFLSISFLLGKYSITSGVGIVTRRHIKILHMSPPSYNITLMDISERERVTCHGSFSEL